MWRKRGTNRRKKDRREAQIPVKHNKRVCKDRRSRINRRKSMKE